MPDRPPPEAIVLRFPPGGPDQVKKIMQEAKYVNRHHQGVGAELWYRLSIWADVQVGDETEEQTVLRLIHAASLGNVQIYDVRNDRFWWTRAAQLYKAGFEISKDLEDGEPAEHYSVDLGHEASREAVERFVAAFGPPETTERYVRDDSQS